MNKAHKNYKIKNKYIRFFWKRCAMCKKDFKKENGFVASWWEAWSGDLLHNKIWFCMKCAPTEKEVGEFMSAVNLGAHF